MPYCKQVKCLFNQIQGCPVCSECGSPANIVDDNCVTCHNCMYDEGELRGRVNLNLKDDVKVNIKEEGIIEVR